MKVLIVDDEPLARARLRTLLGDCGAVVSGDPAEAADVPAALQRLQREHFDVVLLDIHMPGADGLSLAAALRSMAAPPAVVFVTAHPDHALAAFELEAVDYLTKPVRLERLQQALQKSQRIIKSRSGSAAESTHETLLIQDRGRAERVPLVEVLYLKAELKYVTVRTALHSHIFDGSLADIEARHGERFLRVHRNALVARWAIRALERHHDPEEGDGWALRLHGIDDRLAVSRRQLAAVREALGEAV